MQRRDALKLSLIAAAECICGNGARSLLPAAEPGQAAPSVKPIAERICLFTDHLVWEKTGKGWQTLWCPLGEGMVDWPEVFRQLARFPFPGPLSIHIEYDPGGSTRSERIDNSLAAAQRDVAFVRKHLAEAAVAK